LESFESGAAPQEESDPSSVTHKRKSASQKTPNDSTLDEQDSLVLSAEDVKETIDRINANPSTLVKPSGHRAIARGKRRAAR